jgi:hypothetical protein
MSNDLTNFILGAVINLLVVVIIVRFIYYPLTQNRSYVFSFLAFSPTIYFVMGLLTSIELSIGVGFGLFAIFSVLRYRTEEMPIREMTYLFIIIALPVMNSVLAEGDEVGKLAVANVSVLVLLYILEREWGFRFEVNKKITYERIDLITPENHDRLLEDLRTRTGLPVKRVDIGRLDFLRDTAELVVYYDPPEPAKHEGRAIGLAAEYQPAGRHLLDR